MSDPKGEYQYNIPSYSKMYLSCPSDNVINYVDAFESLSSGISVEAARLDTRRVFHVTMSTNSNILKGGPPNTSATSTTLTDTTLDLRTNELVGMWVILTISGVGEVGDVVASNTNDTITFTSLDPLSIAGATPTYRVIGYTFFDVPKIEALNDSGFTGVGAYAWWAGYNDKTAIAYDHRYSPRFTDASNNFEFTNTAEYNIQSAHKHSTTQIIYVSNEIDSLVIATNSTMATESTIAIKDSTFEVIELIGTTDAELAEDDIEQASIVVKSLDGVTTYVKDTDYTLTVSGVKTDIKRIVTGSIGDGDNVKVYYSYPYPDKYKPTGITFRTGNQYWICSRENFKVSVIDYTTGRIPLEFDFTLGSSAPGSYAPIDIMFFEDENGVSTECLWVVCSDYKVRKVCIASVLGLGSSILKNKTGRVYVAYTKDA